MKKTAIIFVLLVHTLQLQAQLNKPIEESRYHIVKVNVLSPFLTVVNIHYEINHHKDASSQVELFYFGGDFFNQQIGVRGIGVTYNYRYYLTQSYPAGWYAQPYLRYQYYWPETGPVNERFNSIGTGIVFGRQFVFAKRIILDGFLGPSYNQAAINGVRLNTNDFLPMLKGPWFRAGFTVGFMF